jgi:hypothetical protein
MHLSGIAAEDSPALMKPQYAGEIFSFQKPFWL